MLCLSVQCIFFSIQVPLFSQMCFHQGCLAFNQGPKGDYMPLKSLSRHSILVVLFSPHLYFSESFCLYVFNSLAVQFSKGLVERCIPVMQS